jgi:hypothetical protein
VTEADKDAMLRAIIERANIAEQNGLPLTAKSWRDCYHNAAMRPAADIICSNKSAVVTDDSASLAPLA